MAEEYSRGPGFPGVQRDAPPPGDRGQHRAPERSWQLRGPDPVFRRQAFLAGTAVGSAGLAVRARLVRGLLTDAVADALVLFRAGVVLLRGALLAGAAGVSAA